MNANQEIPVVIQMPPVYIMKDHLAVFVIVVIGVMVQAVKVNLYSAAYITISGGDARFEKFPTSVSLNRVT